MNAVAGFESQAAGAPQTGPLAPESGFYPLSGTPVGHDFQPSALSFRSNWQSQFSEVAITTDPDGRQKVDLAKAGIAKQQEESADHILKKGLSLDPQLPALGTAPKQIPEQAVNPNRIDGADLRARSISDGGKRWPGLPHSRRAAIETSHADQTPGGQTPDASHPVHARRESSIDSLQPILRSVEIPLSTSSKIDSGEKKADGYTSAIFAAAGYSSAASIELKRPPLSVAPAQFSSNEGSSRIGSHLTSVQSPWPAIESLPTTQMQPALSETIPRHQTDAPSLQSFQRPFGIAAPVCSGAADDSGAGLTSEEGARPASGMPSHQEPSQTDLSAPAQNAGTAAALLQKQGEETVLMCHLPSPDVNENMNGSELVAATTTEHKKIAQRSSKSVESVSDSAKIPAQSAVLVNTDGHVSTVSNTIHLSSERANHQSFAGVEFVDAASTQNATSAPAHLINVSHATRDTFNALDSVTSIPNANWGSVNGHRAEAGFLDSSLGWVGIRAEVNGGAVHATISGSSLEAAQVLGGHLAGLGQYLVDHRTPVESLTLSSPSGHDLSGFGASEQDGNRKGARQEQPDPGRSVSNRTQDGWQVQKNVPELILTRPAEGGTYISVIA